MRKQGIPVEAQVEFRFWEPVKALVKGIQPAVARLVAEEHGCGVSAFQDEVIPSRLFHEVAHLHAAGAGADDDVIVISHSISSLVSSSANYKTVSGTYGFLLDPKYREKAG